MKITLTAFFVRISSLRSEEKGGNLIEYSLLIAFIALAANFAITQVGQRTLENTASILPGL